MRLRIRSDGTPPGTSVFVVHAHEGGDETEHRLERVQAVSWSIDLESNAKATLAVDRVEVELDATLARGQSTMGGNA